MCGIIGVSVERLRCQELSAVRLAEQGLPTLLHRGPDAQGVAGDVEAAIGMCHLRVRSRKAVPVPFADRDGAYAYNGEVYWDGSTAPADGLAEARAVATENRPGLDGMYAFAWMRNDGVIEVGRDPLGIKPLYVREGDGFAAIASELPALARMASGCTVRPEAIAQFLLLGQVVDGRGWHREVFPLQPGSRVCLEDGRVAELREKQDEGSGTVPDAGDIRSAVSLAIERVLIADRPVGLALSGGLDSSIVADELARIGVEGLRTVSVVFPGQEREDGVADLGALELPGDAWKSWSHRWEPFGAEDLLDTLPEAVTALGEPTSLTSTTMYGRLATLASRSEVVVLLLGEGADELFGGYRSYLPLAEMSSALDFYMPGAGLRRRVERLLDEEACAGAVRALASSLPSGEDPIEQVRDFELEQSLQPLLRRADALLMAKSIEGRTPFLHGRLPGLGRRQGWSDLVGRDQTKIALREAFSAELPRFANERKQPFRAPLASWMAPLATRLGEEVEEQAEVLAEAGLNPEEVLRLAAADPQDAEAAGLAFRLLTLGLWLRTQS